MKTLILYCFCRDKYNKNLKTYLINGLFKSDKYDFILIRNNNNFNYNQELNLYLYDNVWLFLRPNIGYDFGGWNDALFLPPSILKEKILHKPDRKPQKYLYQNYERIIFLNDTVIGPFIPNYLANPWPYYFTFNQRDNIGIVCVSMNAGSGFWLRLKYRTFTDNIQKQYGIQTEDMTHAQSFAFSLTPESLKTLLNYKFFKYDNQNLYQIAKNKDELIQCYEMGMSAILRHEGYDIYSLRNDQGLIKNDQTVKTNNIWTYKISDYPAMETIFLKQTPYIQYHDADRYRSN